MVVLRPGQGLQPILTGHYPFPFLGPLQFSRTPRHGGASAEPVPVEVNSSYIYITICRCKLFLQSDTLRPGKSAEAGVDGDAESRTNHTTGALRKTALKKRWNFYLEKW
jgi:hypothetical protein